MSAVAGVGPAVGHRRAWVAWVTVCVVWGTTYLAIKVGLETVPPFVLGGVRQVLGGLAIAGIVLARGRALPPRADWGRLAVIGALMITLGNGGVVTGEQFVPSGLTAVLLATSAFWMVGVNTIMDGGDGLHPRHWMGLAVGFCGIILLVWPDIFVGGARGREFALGVLSLQVACAGWAFGSHYTRRRVLSRDAMGAAALQMISGGALMLVVATVTGEWRHTAITPRTLAAWIYLLVIGSLVGFVAFSYALQHLPITVVSLYTYINPVIAVLLGILVLHEPFEPRMLAAALVIGAGIVIVGPTSRGRT